MEQSNTSAVIDVSAIPHRPIPEASFQALEGEITILEAEIAMAARQMLEHGEGATGDQAEWIIPWIVVIVMIESVLVILACLALGLA